MEISAILYGMGRTLVAAALAVFVGAIAVFALFANHDGSVIAPAPVESRPTKLLGERGQTDAEPQQPSKNSPRGNASLEEVDLVSNTDDYGQEDHNETEWPSNIENRIYEFFASQTDYVITSIMSIDCSNTECDISFTVPDIARRTVDEFSELKSAMRREGWGIMQGSIGTREVAPGVRVFYIDISNVPVDMDEMVRQRALAEQQSTDKE